MPSQETTLGRGCGVRWRVEMGRVRVRREGDQSADTPSTSPTVLATPPTLRSEPASRACPARRSRWQHTARQQFCILVLQAHPTFPPSHLLHSPLPLHPSHICLHFSYPSPHPRICSHDNRQTIHLLQSEAGSPGEAALWQRDGGQVRGEAAAGP